MKKIMLIYLCILFLLTSSYAMEFTIPINSTGAIGVLLVLIILFGIFIRVRSIKFDGIIFFSYLLFILTLLISALYHSSMSLFGRSLFLLLIYISLVIVLPSILSKYNISQKIVPITFVIVYIPIIIIPYFFFGEASDKKYLGISGVYQNPNMFAIIIATTIVILFSFIMNDQVNGKLRNKRNISFQVTLLLVLLYMQFLTTSRGGILSIIISILFVFLVKFVRLRKLNSINIGRIGKYTFFTVPILVLTGLFFWDFVSKVVYDKFIYKFELKEDRIFDGRETVWSTIINDSKFLGNGSTYFDNMILGSHNSFLNLIAEFGWLSFVMLIIFLIIVVIRFIKYSNIPGQYFRYLPIMAVVLFIVYSIVENLFFTSPMYILFIQIGAVSQERLRSF